ncbi:bb3-type cytochrome oxidase subunit III [Schlegelella sp. S2-27]|uniref:Bb3-type cytochrome oxidase subunit III n=1 Tax=Caldimonas mangrovi TaxID=2944811 RepID=A0ABT0YH54_9BURK|nr:bb3-type cytochrome oxidase subunit III [Caldimonas mangrovi]MCM5678065.1 bb3-type cytochrome oxidase subunit III [Caldimonas mangrovi]
MSHASVIAAPAERRLPAPADIGLWVFIGMATSLFTLFVAAYVMRMEGSDWSAIGMPWQLWLGTACLAGGSLSMQRAAVTARRAQTGARGLLVGGGCALAFVAVQLWGWQELQARMVAATGNPAASFFYLLTAVHALHVLGGLAAWGYTVRRLQVRRDPGGDAMRISLCARYWHFLLAAWLLVFSTLSGLTPSVVRFICGIPAGA